MAKKLIVISGMHRSGTSALTKLIINLGFDAGNNLMPASTDNPLGFWEDIDVVNLNNNILNTLFLTYDRLENINERRINLFNEIIWNKFNVQAYKLISEKFKQSDLIVIKDPRFSILFPFWNKIFNQIEADTYFIHTIRNPLSVAKSLEKRDGTPIKNGLLLWYYYNISTLYELDKPICFVSYQEMMDHPAATLKRINLFTDIQTGFKTEKYDEIGKLSLNKKFNHHQSSDSKLKTESNFFPEISHLWKLMLQYSEKQTKLIDQKDLINFNKDDLLKYAFPDKATKSSSNLHCYNSKTNDPPKIIKLQHEIGKTNLRFEINSSNQYDEFYLHFCDKPCHIKLDLISLTTVDKKEEIESIRGNFLYNQNNHYFFSSNSPFIFFSYLPDTEIKYIEINLSIELLENYKAEVLFTILQDQQLRVLQENKEHITKNEELHNCLKKKESENEKLSGDSRKSQDEIIHLQNQIKEFQSVGKQQESEIELQELKIKKQNTDAKEKESEIKNFKVKISLLEKQKAESHTKLKNATSENERLLMEVDEYNKRSIQLQQKIEKSQSIIELQKQDHQETKSEIAKLEKKSLWLFNERNKIRDSISWRFTYPLRWISNLLRKLLHFGFVLKNDVKIGSEIFKRDGLSGFMYRLWWYLRGKRLTEDIDLKKNSLNAENKFEDKITFQPIKFKQEENPLVSIIIPVHNQWAYTYNCLESISNNTKDISYEIIIADDVSIDKTTKIGNFIKNIKLVRNEQNLGFLRNCNKAAKHAKGKYIHFLNNDTEVHPKWLSSLVELIESNNKNGLVGSKLIFSDGKLQEAGGIIWNDASGWNYGRSDNAEKSEYNYIKEVDYVSGASMLIEKTVWERLDGFDEQYSPAYFEDTDLAYRIREAGLKVMYQPLSVVTHFEGISNGTDESSGIKKFQVENRNKFLNRWNEVLQNESSPNAENVFVHRDRSLKKKHMLVIDHYVPHFDQDAGSRSTFSYIKLFVKMGYSVKFIGDNFYRHQPYTSILQQMGVEVLYGDYYQRNISEWIKTNGKYFDYIIAHRMHIAPKYLDVLRQYSFAKLAYIGHDLQFVSSMRKFESTNKKSHEEDSINFKKIESKIFETVDIILPFSTYEAPFIKDMVPDKVVRTIPVFFYESITTTKIKFSNRKDILFVGFFGHPPNVDAIIWFTNKIFPLLQKSIPDIKLHIVGSKPNDEIRKLENESIDVTGFVSDERLKKYYQQCRVAVLPLRFGAGVKGKLLESLYHQLPSVITSIAAEGVPEIEEYTLIADEAKEFAEKIQLLYSDEDVWNKYASNGKELIQKYYTENSARKILEEIFEN